MKRYLWLLFVVGTALGVGSMAIARVAPSISGGSGNGRIKSINAGSQVNVSDDGQGNVTISATPPSQGSAGDSIASSTIVVINADNEGSGDGYISMRINNSTKAVVAPNGRVGINTTNPSTELEVSGVITATSIDANLAANKVQAGALGASVMGSSVAAQVVNGDSLKSTNKATDGLVPKFDAATGGVTWSADNAGGSGGSDNFGTHTASKTIDAGGFSITRVSSISFVSGAKVSSFTAEGTITSTSGFIGPVSSAAVNTITVAQQFNASSPGSGKVLSMNADNTLAWATDQTAAGGGDNMGNHVATMPVVSQFAITVASGTVYGQLSVGSITVVSAGAGVINSTHAVMKIKVTDLSDDDFEVAEDSVSVNGVRISTYQPNTSAVLANHSLDATANGNVISFRDQDRFTSPSFASGTFVTYIATPTMGISSSTIGHFQFHNAISSQANFAVYAWIPPSDIDLTANVILSSFGVILGGADTGTQRYVVAISTTMDGRPARETMFSGPYGWLEGINVDVPANTAGANGYLEVVGNTTLTNWQTRIIPGALHYISVARDGDAAQDGSTIDSYSSFFSVSYKRRLAQ